MSCSSGSAVFSSYGMCNPTTFRKRPLLNMLKFSHAVKIDYNQTTYVYVISPCKQPIFVSDRDHFQVATVIQKLIFFYLLLPCSLRIGLLMPEDVSGTTRRVNARRISVNTNVDGKRRKTKLPRLTNQRRV